MFRLQNCSRCIKVEPMLSFSQIYFEILYTIYHQPVICIILHLIYHHFRSLGTAIKVIKE